MDALLPSDSPVLFERGLLLRGVLAMDMLPSGVRNAIAAAGPGLLDHRQLLVFGHAGPRMWRALRKAQPEPWTSADPVDEFSLATVRAHLEDELGVHRWAPVYPGPALIPLQELGTLLGWHHPSPLLVGISEAFGTWFAYRAVVVADTTLPLTPPASPQPSPCSTCVEKPCLSACLGAALTTGTLTIDRCTTFRVGEASPCALRCPAREACPIGAEHRYDADQIRYHYGTSLTTIRRMQRSTFPRST
jgi:epoxyqueuosine reductase